MVQPRKEMMVQPLDFVRLTPLLERTSGTSAVTIAMIDGPVMLNHPGLATSQIRELAGSGASGGGSRDNGLANLHGTFIAGMLAAKRGSQAPAICPGCVLLVRPIFTGTSHARAGMASANARELAAAIHQCIDAGARIINLNVALERASPSEERELAQVLDQALMRGVIVVAAAGSQGTLGGSVITRHAWTIPVAALDENGRLMETSNLGSAIGRQGLGAPGDKITSLGVNGSPLTLSGANVAAPFVTGAVALLWSLRPQANAAEIRLAITQAYAPRRSMVTPPLLDAWGSYQHLLSVHARRRWA